MEFNCTDNTLSYMYRYLLKFVGKYRVKAYFCENAGDFPRNEHNKIDESFEDLYIPCSRGGVVIKHTYLGDDILAICGYDKASTIKNIYKELQDKYKKKLDIKLDIDGYDGFIYFYSDDIKKIATVVKPRTSGAKIDPFSNKNLPKIDYEIPKEDLDKYKSITNKIESKNKMSVMRSINAHFLESISTKKFNAKEEMKLSRLAAREYIHSTGHWEKYLRFIKKSIK